MEQRQVSQNCTYREVHPDSSECIHPKSPSFPIQSASASTFFILSAILNSIAQQHVLTEGLDGLLLCEAVADDTWMILTPHPALVSTRGTI